MNRASLSLEHEAAIGRGRRARPEEAASEELGLARGNELAAQIEIDVDASEPIRVYDKQVGSELSHPAFIDTLEDFRMAVRTGDVTIPEVSGLPPLLNECEWFLDAVLLGKPTLSGAEEGIEVVRALAALSESLESRGAEIEVRR